MSMSQASLYEVTYCRSPEYSQCYFCLEFANPGDNAYTPSRKRMKHPGLEIHSKGIMGAYRDLCGHIEVAR